METEYSDALLDTEIAVDGLFADLGELQQADGQGETSGGADATDLQEAAVKKKNKKTGSQLNEKTLCSKVGLSALVQIFENVTFKSKNEEENLDQLMKKFEYWAHQMYPRYAFEDVIDKVEELGNKKMVKQHSYGVKLGQVVQIEDENREILQTENAIEDEAAASCILDKQV